ncbi:hypothetical protein P7C70_g1377, partial [Phenoliferia sp. Uapishka_3]
METIGGFAPIQDSRPVTPAPPTPAASTDPDVASTESTPTSAPVANVPAAAQPTLDQELASVIGSFGSFWGKVKKQSASAYQTANAQLDQTISTARADLTPLVTKARANLDQLQESTKAELARLQEASANMSQGGSNVMIGADGTPVIVDVPEPKVDKGKGVDPGERGDGTTTTTQEGGAEATNTTDHSANPAASATAFFSSLQSRLSTDPNLSQLSKNFQQSLATAQSSLATAQASAQSSLQHLPSSFQHLPSQLQTNMATLSQQINLPHLDQKSAEEYLSKGEHWLAEFSSEVQRLAKDAVRVVPPTEEEARLTKREEKIRADEEKSLGRTDVLVQKLRNDRHLLLIDPAQPPIVPEVDATAPAEDLSKSTATMLAPTDTREAFSLFLTKVIDAGGFEGESWAKRVAAETDEALLRTKDALVGVGKLSPEAFWSRYFFRREEIDEEERRRKAVLLQKFDFHRRRSRRRRGLFLGPRRRRFRSSSFSQGPRTFRGTSFFLRSNSHLRSTPSTTNPSSTGTAEEPLSHSVTRQASSSSNSDDKNKSPRNSSDGASSYDVVGERSGAPSEVGGAEEHAEPKKTFAQTKPAAVPAEEGSEGEDSDWE